MYIQPSNKKKFTTPKSNIAYSKNIRTRRKLRTKKRSAKAGAEKNTFFILLRVRRKRDTITKRYTMSIYYIYRQNLERKLVTIMSV